MTDDLKQKMHDAPMNPVFTTHDGHKFLGNHSDAWARFSREWTEEKKRKAEKETP